MKNRFVREALEDILKPKSKVEIEEGISKLSAEELWDYYIETGYKDFLVSAFKKGIKDVSEDELSFVITEQGVDDYNLLIPLIIPHLNFKITKTRSGHNLYFDSWDDFSSFFEDNREISINTIETILKGEDIDRIFNINIDSFSEIDDLGNIFDDIPIANELQKILIKVVRDKGKDISKLEKWEGGFESLFDYILEHENDEELEKIVYAIDSAYCETRAIADENEAQSSLIDAIRERFGFNTKPKIENYLYIVPIDNINLIEMFKIQNGINDGIFYYPPQYGWSGNIRKYKDVFNDALADRLDNIN